MSGVLSAPSLIAPPDNTDNTAIPDLVQDTLSSNQSGLNTAEGSKSEQRESTASGTAKPLCSGEEESVNAIPPLRSVIGVLSGVEGSELARRSSRLCSEVGVEGATETGPRQEGSDIGGGEATPVNDPPISVPSILQGRKPDGM